LRHKRVNGRRRQVRCKNVMQRVKAAVNSAEFGAWPRIITIFRGVILPHNLLLRMAGQNDMVPKVSRLSGFYPQPACLMEAAII
jgi:hypothetical protein